MFSFTGNASSATSIYDSWKSSLVDGSGDSNLRDLLSNAVNRLLFLNTPPSDTLPLQPTSTYKNLQLTSTTAKSTMLKCAYSCSSMSLSWVEALVGHAFRSLLQCNVESSIGCWIVGQFPSTLDSDLGTCVGKYYYEFHFVSQTDEISDNMRTLDSTEEAADKDNELDLE